jgi:hypothetical protein
MQVKAKEEETMAANPIVDGDTALLMHALQEVASAGAPTKSAVAVAAMTMAMQELKPSDVVTNARVTGWAATLGTGVEMLLPTRS